MTSLARRVLAIVAAAAVPLAGAAAFWAPDPLARWLLLSWAAIVMAVAWVVTRSISHRVSELTAFTNELPPGGRARPRLKLADDELGDLARSLSHAAPRIESALRGLHSELARRQAILANMADAVLAVDGKRSVSFCNESFARIAGHPVAEGVPLIKVFRDPGLFQTLGYVIDSGETVRKRLNIGVQDRWFDVYATALTDQPLRGALAILRDETPRERLQRAQRDFVANVSHEFRTPLATITACAETLLNGALDDNQNRHRFLEVIQASSMRLTSIAADLITLSQLDGGAPRAEPAPVPVDEVIASSVRAIEPVAAMHGVSLVSEAASSSWVLGHRLAFEQVLLNLLDNAVKFNKPSGQVRIRAAVAAGNQVEISVADTGIGIPAEDLSRIFERFYRVDKARSRQVGGTGLGLSIVQHGVEQMSGTIDVRSDLGAGSHFTIRLPRHNGRNSS